MGLKRKRSDVNISPESISSFASSRISVSPTPGGNDEMAIDVPVKAQPHSTWEWERRSASPWEVNSRTRKRFRDNRPDETTLHENTINKLFSAQRENPRASPVPSHSSDISTSSINQKSTLHSFWSLPQPPRVSPSAAPHSTGFDNPNLPRCEDCEAALGSSDGMDVDMMDTDDGVDEHQCQVCGRRVCDGCAVSMELRRCLGCACL
ncbi:hypothetical protein NA57DRAFT_51980 [Rhizodiscina lignyota]|uniref:Uncharacterized protein n=1 Tax=Rhizodiscina lignyota TaxID=1504668 RepID=A0A9P4MEA0_9PEZI|nr:hypothetical protein NA57DRAFT_51980 [Rhizodiscina lignyota]